MTAQKRGQSNVNFAPIQGIAYTSAGNPYFCVSFKKDKPTQWLLPIPYLPSKWPPAWA
jgi:hypothetical protein